MNTLKRLIRKMDLWSAENTGFTMLRIAALRHTSLDVLNKNWDIKQYENLEKVRLLAQSEVHCFEELQLLIDEILLLTSEQGEKHLLYVANERLSELSRVFDMDDETFVGRFRQIYYGSSNSKIRAEVLPCLNDLYTYFDKRLNLMSCSLSNNAVILCRKAMCKVIALSAAISHEVP